MKRIAGKVLVGVIVFVGLLLTLLFSIRLVSQQEQSSGTSSVTMELKEVLYDTSFSPNGDGVKDKMQLLARFQGKVHDKIYGLMLIKDQSEYIYISIDEATINNAGEGTLSFSWNGKDYLGKQVAAGRYGIVLYYFNMPQIYQQAKNKNLVPDKALELIMKFLDKVNKTKILKKWEGETEVDRVVPVLNVEAPIDALQVCAETVHSEGTVEGAENFTINGNPVPLSGNRFSLDLNLQIGDNLFNYLAEDLAGNRVTATRTIKRIQDVTAPQIEIQKPKEGDQYKNLPIEVQATYQDEGCGIDLSSVQVSLNGSDITGDLTVNETGISGQIEDENDVQDGNNVLAIKAADKSGNVGNATANFKYEKIAEKDKTFVYGRVFDMGTNEPLSGATITAAGHEATSDGEGLWQLLFPAGGAFNINITKANYTEVFRQAEVKTGQEAVTEDAFLTRLDTTVTPIGPEGGTHTNTDGTVVVEIPEGALTETKPIQVTRLSGSKALPGDLNATDNLEYPISFLFCAQFGPDGTTFAKPVKFKVKNTWGFAVGTEIPIAYWEKNDLKWIPMGMAKIDANMQWLEGETTHFTPMDCNGPVSAQPRTGKADIKIEKSPENNQCDLGSTVDLNNGKLLNDFSIPGLKVLGNITEVKFTYNSFTAFPSASLILEKNHGDDDVIAPKFTSVKIASPLFSGNGTVKEIFLKGRKFDTYWGKAWGGIFLKGLYPSGRFVETGYQNIDITYTNYYPGEYALTQKWGGLPTIKTGIPSQELAYLEESKKKDVFFISRIHSPFGRGWSLDDLKYLYIEGNRAVVIDGSGDFMEYEKGINYADTDFNVSVVDSSATIGNSQMMFTEKAYQAKPYLAIPCWSMARLLYGDNALIVKDGTNQWFIIDLGEEREIYQVGIDFPQYWEENNVWDYIKISTSIDNQNWEECKSFGIPTLKNPVNNASVYDPLDTMISSPVMADFSPKMVRYIKYELGFPSVNNSRNTGTGGVGSIVNRVFAIGDQSKYSRTNEEKWPRLTKDEQSGNYILEEITREQTIFNSNGLMITVKDRFGRSTVYEYENDNLIRILYPGGTWFELQYDSNNKLKIVKDSKGRESEFVCDSEGNLKSIQLFNGSKREFEYNNRGLMVEDKTNDKSKRYIWDANYPVLKEVQLPNGKSRKIKSGIFEYLVNDIESSPEQPIEYPLEERGVNDSTGFKFYTRGIYSSVVLENGKTVKYETNKGWQKKYENDDFVEIKYFGDQTNNKNLVGVESYENVVRWKKAGPNKWGPFEPTTEKANLITGQIRNYFYSNGLIKRIENFPVHGKNYDYFYDKMRNLIQVDEQIYHPNSSKRTTTFTYDSANQLVKIQYPGNQTREFAYDANGMLAEVKNSDGTKMLVNQDVFGNILSITDEENRKMEFEWNDWGQIIKEKSPSGREVKYEWIDSGCSSCGQASEKLKRIIDPNNKAWEFSYDTDGNPIELIYPDGSKISQQFDSEGRLVSFTNRRQQEITFEYDDNGRMIKKTTPEGETAFSYYDKDRIKEIIADQYHYQYGYGGYGVGDPLEIFVTKEENTLTGTWFEQLYDKYGKPFEEADNFKWYKQNTYTYFPGEYPPNNILYAKDYRSEGIISTYALDVNGILRAKAFKSSKTSFYEYNQNGILSQIKLSPSYGQDEILTFTRDKSGIITGLNGSKRFNANYNPDMEITSVQHTLPQAFDENYTYDTRGNRLTSLTDSFTYDDQNQLTASTSHEYEYDADGNLTLEKNKATTETKKYYYDSESRMIAFEHYPTEVSPADIVAEYAYDIYGRRIQKTVNGNVTKFFWYGDNLAYELDSQNKPIRKYFWGYGMDDYEGHLEYAEVTDWYKLLSDPFYQNGWYYYLKDQVGTVYKVLSGLYTPVVDSRVYDVFGNLVSQSGTTKSNLGFQGKYYDQESELNYFYHRYYLPNIGRFTTEDPLGFNGDINQYKFVGNNTINWKDLYGLYAHQGERCYNICMNEFIKIEDVIIMDKTGVAKLKSNNDLIKQIMKEASEEIKETKYFVEECDPKDCLECVKDDSFENEVKSDYFTISKKKGGLFRYSLTFKMKVTAKVSGYAGICQKKK